MNQSDRSALTQFVRWINPIHRYIGLAAISACLILLLSVPLSTTSAALPTELSQARRSISTLDPLLLIRQISVRIVGTQTTGSGVLIAQQNHQYTVLTNAHVVAGNPGSYTILTEDGEIYSGEWLREVQVAGQDLALVQFSSSQSYPVVQLRLGHRFRIGETVYAAGFPNWRLVSPTHLEETRTEGFGALEVTTGQVKLLLPKPLEEGYQLGYTNEITSGMSGGPVLDRNGRLVGINGGLKYPPQGISAFTFADGTLPSISLFEQMEALSWAIPVSTIRQVLSSQITLASQPNFHS